MKERFARLIDVKSFVTLAMTAALIVLLFVPTSASDEFKTLFCTSYGAITTYFFTKKPKEE